MTKENISYAGRKVSFGIDVHRSFFVVSAVSEGQLARRCRMTACGESVLSFIRKYFAGAEVRTCYEAGYSGFWLHRYLVSQGIDNIVVNPASIEVEAGNRVKTDKRDSLKMAEQLDAKRLRGIYVPSEEQESKRLLTRTRMQLVQARTRARIQIRMKLHQFGLFPAGVSQVLKTTLARHLIAGVKQFELRTALESLLSQWHHLNLEIAKLQEAANERARDDSITAVYLGVPGMGPVISQVLANELGDMSQFENEKQLFSYTGLTPCEYSSGDNVRKGHISRRGNSRLRHALTEAAWRTIRKDRVLREDYLRLSKRRGKKRAIVAIARRLIGRVRAVFRAKSAYEVERKKAA